MAAGSGGPLARLWDGDSVAGLTDGQLLDRFASRRGSAAEAAFAALVARHGPMVARVCRARLRDEHDAEDAFQATFLVLARRAGSIGERDLLAAWLYGVAHRVARKARAVAMRRRGREGGPAPVDPPGRDGVDAFAVDLAPVLHEEVDRLPEKYRRPVVLCHLQGLTHAQAAQELAWPVGTVSVRLARARKILADRLSRRGVTASAGLVATALAGEASAALAPTWAHAATTAALASLRWLPLSAATAAGAASAPAAALARRTSMTLLLAPCKWLAPAAAVAALTTAAGTALVGPPGPGSPSDQPQAPAAPPATQVGPVPGPPAFLLPRFELTNPKFFPTGAPAGATMIRGTLADLPATVERLQGSSPQTPYKLYLSARDLPVSDPSDPFARSVKIRDPSLPNSVTSGEAAIIHGTLADLAMTAKGVQGSGSDMPYQLVLSGADASPEAKLPGDAKAVGNPEQQRPKDEEPQEEVVPPLIRLPGGGVDLGPNPPAGYFDLPNPDPNNPNAPKPVQVGQKIQVEALEALPGRPLTGIRVVRPDGTISLGFYGDLRVAGLNRDQIKVKLIEKLRHYLIDRVLGLMSYQGNRIVPVPPVESNCVFVDDQPDLTRPAPTPARAPRPKTPPAQPAPVPSVEPKGDGPAANRVASPPPAQSSTVEPRLDAELSGDRARYVGQQVDYRLAVTNRGSAASQAVRVVVTLPTQGGRLARVPAGSGFSPKDRKLTWKLPGLEPGQTFEDHVLYNTSTPGLYRCTLEAVSGDLRAEGALATEVTGIADLDFKLSQAGRVIDVGKTNFYDFVVKNLGTKEATNLRLGGHLVNLKVVKMFAGEAGGPGDSKPESNGQPAQFVFPKVARLAPGESISLSLEVEALRGPQASASVELAYDQADGRGGRVESTIATRVVEASAATVGAGGPLRLPPVEVGQTLVVEVLEALPGRPITGERVVRPDGTIGLGFYGDVAVAGLTRDEVKVRVVEHLRKYLKDEALGLKAVNPRTGQAEAVDPLRSDRVFVTPDYDPSRVARGPGPDGRIQVGQVVAVDVLEALPGRPITGWRLVGPDGRINLGYYGDVAAAGLTRAELKAKVVEHLRGKLTDEQLGLIADEADDNARGGRRPVAPADSTKVAVDDVVPAPEPEGEVERLRREVAELNGKLNGVYNAIDRLGRARPSPAEPAPAPATP